MDGDDVDDIFKSFVSKKLKQLGLSGGTSTELENSLKISALDKINLNTPKDDVDVGSDPISEKIDKEMKSKKHKKEKKKKKKVKKKEERKEKLKNEKTRKSSSNIYLSRSINASLLSNDKFDDELLFNCNEVHDAINHAIKPVKKKIQVQDDDEIVIKKKKLNCYHDTVSKLKEIEKLPLTIEQSDTTSAYAKENNDADVLISKPPVKEDESKHEANVSKSKPAQINNEHKTINMDICIKETPNSNLLKDVITNRELHKSDDGNTVCKNVNETDNKIAASKIANMLNGLVDGKSTVEHVITKTEIKDNKHHSTRRSRSRSRKRSRSSRSRHRSSRSPRRHRHHHRRTTDSHRRHKSSSRHKRSPPPMISSRDKVKLLEIAKANVLAQHKADMTISVLSHESKAMLRSGGVTLKQLTGVCQDIVEGKREVLSSDTQVDAQPSKVNHPFQVREASSISINIKNRLPAIPGPAKPINELTKEFPVSCGSQHQRKEVLEEVYGKWEPIVKDEETKQSIKAVITEKVFPDAPTHNTLTIKEVIAQRVSAVRELQTNPNDVAAMKNILESQQKLDTWTCSKQMPGRFTGQTGLQPLKKSELERGHQAWATSHSLNSGKLVGGIGRSLLQKMGWNEGESLGKTNAGMLEPLKVSIKTDRKGLSSIMEAPVVPPTLPARTGNHIVLKDLSGKHPVSALMEICSKRRWKPPDFLLVMHDGPDHNRNFMFKVQVDGTFYQPSLPSLNKKLAKAQAASAALQAMGLVPG